MVKSLVATKIMTTPAKVDAPKIVDWTIKEVKTFDTTTTNSFIDLYLMHGPLSPVFSDVVHISVFSTATSDKC